MRFVRERKVKQGSTYLDVDIYSYSTEQMRRLPKAKRRKLTPPKQFAENDKNAKKSFVQLVNTNFGEEDYLLDLTYASTPDPEFAEAELKRCLARLKYLYKKHDVEFRYIAVTEGGRPKQNGEGYTRIHHHLFISGGVPRDEVEKCWSMGRRKCDRVQILDGENGLEARARYVLKAQRRPEDKHAKRWTGSRNLKKPVETRNDNKYTPKKVGKLQEAHTEGKAKELIEKWYKGYVCTDYEIKTNPVTWQPEIYIKLRRDKNAPQTGKIPI